MERRTIAYYGTLGPACESEETLYEMFQMGMTGVRLNLSHTGLIECKGWIEHLQNAAKRAGKKAELLIDLQGPELRVGVLKEPLLMKDGEVAALQKTEQQGGIPVPEEIFPALEIGQQILIDDGVILVEVTEIVEDKAYVKVLRGGKLQSRKSLALIGKTVWLPTLTEKDKNNLKVAKQFHVTAVMVPFVRNKQDLINVRKALFDTGNADIQIFAKIENMQGVEQIEELLEEADQIIIARGDLGNAMPLWELPAVQKYLSDCCIRANKPFMVVTQMLHSMTHSKVPTRAEVSDIYHAVLDGASSVMVTGETAAGEYPVEVMKYLVKTGEMAIKGFSI